MNVIKLQRIILHTGSSFVHVLYFVLFFWVSLLCHDDIIITFDKFIVFTASSRERRWCYRSGLLGVE